MFILLISHDFWLVSTVLFVKKQQKNHFKNYGMVLN